MPTSTRPAEDGERRDSEVRHGVGAGRREHRGCRDDLRRAGGCDRRAARSSRVRRVRPGRSGIGRVGRIRRVGRIGRVRIRGSIGSVGSVGTTMVVEPSVSLSPITEIALPPIVMGRDRSGMSCVPPSSPSDPSVVAEPPPVPGTTIVVASVDVLSPMPEIALPPIVIGRSRSASSWVPPRIESSPRSTRRHRRPAAGGDPGWRRLTSRRYGDGVAATVTGPTGDEPCVPPRIECRSSAPTRRRMPRRAAPTTVSASLDELSPMTEIALPPMVTGAETSMSACVPDPMPSSPEVTATGSASPPPVMTSVEASDDCESPMREIALPPTVTGSSIEIPTWEPDRMPSSPLVSDAWATPARGA